LPASLASTHRPNRFQPVPTCSASDEDAFGGFLPHGTSMTKPPTNHRVVAITGASSGIGRCTAILFASRGWRVGLIARGEAGLRSAQAEIEGAGGTACMTVADVRDAAALERAADSIERALGTIDVWINCAGNGVYGRFVDVPPEEFDCVTDVTYRGTVNGTRAALRRMLPRNAGTVVNVCSAIAYHGMPLLTSYSGAKAAVRGFTDGVRAELAHDASRVHVTIVFPPAVNTPFFSHAATHMARPPRPAKPVYQPEIVAAGILHAATARRREVRVGAITTLFELGNKMVPGLVDRAIGRLGYEGQETDSPEAARLRDPTLFAASARASGNRGPFNDEAKGVPALDWAFRVPGMLVVGAALAAVLVLL
jgi:short-subunit dehydrogenase